MDKAVKTIIIIAAAMIGLGLILAGIGYLAGGNQSINFGNGFIRLGNQGGSPFGGKVEKVSDELDAFQNIDADLGFYDVDLIPSDKYRIECTYDSDYGKPSYKVENDTLIITEEKHNRISINVLGFDLSDMNDRNVGVKIYYPENAKLGKVKINCDASDLSFENLTVEEATFDIDFGELELQNIVAKNINVDMNSGDCKITNSVADQSDINLDFGELVTKNFKTKSMDVKASSGDLELQGTFLGNTDIQCDFGEVTVNTDVPKDQYSYELDVDMGSVYIGGKNASAATSVLGATSSNMLKIQASMGDIRVNFKQ